MICVDWCLLNIHKGSISSIADFFFLLFPTGHGLPAVILVYKGFDGTLCSSTAFVFMYFLLFASGLLSASSWWPFIGRPKVNGWARMIYMTVLYWDGSEWDIKVRCFYMVQDTLKSFKSVEFKLAENRMWGFPSRCSFWRCLFTLKMNV